MSYMPYGVPLEILIKILSCLGIKDARYCRLVNKTWKYAIDNYSLVELSLFLNCPKQTTLLKFDNFYLSAEKGLCFQNEEIFKYDLSFKFRNLRVLCFSETSFYSNLFQNQFEELISKFFLLLFLLYSFSYLFLFRFIWKSGTLGIKITLPKFWFIKAQ